MISRIYIPEIPLLFAGEFSLAFRSVFISIQVLPICFFTNNPTFLYCKLTKI